MQISYGNGWWFAIIKKNEGQYIKLWQQAY